MTTTQKLLKKIGCTAEQIVGSLVTQAMNCGYTIEVSDAFDITLSANDPEMKLPEIEVTTHSQRPGYFVFTAKLTFPVLDTKLEHYYDSVEYYLKNWDYVGKFITQLCEAEVDLYNYIDE